MEEEKFTITIRANGQGGVTMEFEPTLGDIEDEAIILSVQAMMMGLRQIASGGISAMNEEGERDQLYDGHELGEHEELLDD